MVDSGRELHLDLGDGDRCTSMVDSGRELHLDLGDGDTCTSMVDSGGELHLDLGDGDRCTSMVDSGGELHLDLGDGDFEPGLQRLGGRPRPVVRGRQDHTDPGPPLYVKNHMTDATATGRAMFSARSRDLKSPMSISLLQITVKYSLQSNPPKNNP